MPTASKHTPPAAVPSPEIDPALEPHLDWLARRWALPAEARVTVARLISSENSGDTALCLQDSAVAAGWGAALCEAGGSEEPTAAPLVRIQHQGNAYLQSWRLYHAEHAIALGLRLRLADTRALAAGGRSAPDPGPGIRTLFPDAEQDDLQVLATRTALSRNLALITGGPGTGKTYTLARILALLLLQASEAAKADPELLPPRIRLAAPTGKAADRMKEAVRDSVKGLPEEFRAFEPELLRAAESSCTLHSLLGYNPDTGSCAHRADNPLPCEVLIIDEASMIDVLLWKATLAALPTGARTRLIVLGDPYQLESVGAGDVLHQLVNAPELQTAHVQLTRTRRFKDRPDIENLANTLIRNDGEAARTLMMQRTDHSATAGLAWLGDQFHRDFWQNLPATLITKIEAAAQATTPTEALHALTRLRILTAHRESPLGARGIGEAIGRHLRRATPANTRPPNEPIIINVNDPETGLRNGSVGVLLTNAEGERKAWFPAPREGEQPLSFPLGKLPEYSVAWALTIHRSQGSEFDDVLVVLPHEDSPLASRELIYTAITRAKRTVFLLGSLETISRAVADTERRCTLLAWQLSR
jgi:exodeoxyribonuclease V alpha subunit